MSDAPVNPDSGREGQQRGRGEEQRQHHRGSRRLGFIGRYVQGAHIDPTSNMFDYVLFAAIVVIALLIARSWQGSGKIHTAAQVAPPISSGLAGKDTPGSEGPTQYGSSITPGGKGGSRSAGAGGGHGGSSSASGGQDGVTADGGPGGPPSVGGGPAGTPAGAVGPLDGPDTVLAAGRAETGELENDKPLPPSRHGRTPPKVIHREPATYTNEARFARFKGKVTAVFTVDEEGAPQNIELAAPAPYDLGERAIAAVRKWRYQPATQDGKPVGVRLVEEVPFR